MPDFNPPVGQLFTHVYMQGSPAIQDSEPFRRRLGSFLVNNFSNQRSDLVTFLRQETGLQVPWRGQSWDLEKLFVTVDVKYLLNLITLTWRHFYLTERTSTQHSSAYRWHQFVTRTLREENLGYRLDEQCGVHYFVDEEFERNRVATLSGMRAERYAGVRAAFDASFQYLDSTPPDTKAAVRSTFESLEILAKLMVETNNLNKWLVENSLKQKVLPQYADDEVACTVVTGMFDSFAKWVDSIHLYRHGQGQESPVAPPIDLTIYIISTGASFLRWLVEIDSRMQIQAMG